jgi:hypothetical protein
MSAKAGCTFQLRLDFWQRKGQAPEVCPVETAPHCNHVLGSREDALLLRPDRTLEERATVLLKLGVKPMTVRTREQWTVRACTLREQ